MVEKHGENTLARNRNFVRGERKEVVLRGK